jgi:hypothetical protein
MTSFIAVSSIALEAYCRRKWQYGRRYVDQIISAAALFGHLRAISSQSPPEHETQLRPLVGLTLEQAALAWQCAVTNAGEGKVTARLVKEAVKQLGFASTKPSKTAPRQTRAELPRAIDATLGELLLLLSQGAAHDLLTARVETLHSLIRRLFATSAFKI